MNKKLIAMAVAAAFAAPAAMADAVIYGKAHVSLDMNDVEFDGDTVTDNYEVNSRASRVGLKGSEDLGGGLKAIYQVEMGFDWDGGDQQDSAGDIGLSQRNTFIGLAGGWGTFLVGRHDTPAKVAFYAAGNERLGDSIIDLNSGVVGVFTEVRANNAIAYISPNFSGFTFAAAAVPGEESGADGVNNSSDGLTDHYSLGVMYSGNGLKASVGYEEFDNQGPNLRILNGKVPLGSLGYLGQPEGADEGDITVLQVGASYTMNNFSVGAHYQDTDIDDSDVNAGDAEYTAWAITGKATFGNNAVSLVYTWADAEIDGDDVADSDGWGLAAEHNFSKRTKVYAAYAMGEVDFDDTDADFDEDVFSLGMIHSF
jgi:predicted porin